MFTSSSMISPCVADMENTTRPQTCCQPLRFRNTYIRSSRTFRNKVRNNVTPLRCPNLIVMLSDSFLILTWTNKRHFYIPVTFNFSQNILISRSDTSSADADASVRLCDGHRDTKTLGLV